jgi:polyphenol oxidase
MDIFQRTGKHLELKPWKEYDSELVAGFTTREGGYSPLPFHSLNMGFHVFDRQDLVQKNRAVLAAEIGFPLHTWVGTKQVHLTNIVEVTTNDQGKGACDFNTAIPDADGIYTKASGVLLTSLYADCVPLYFYSEKNSLIGLAHAGWRGTVGEIGPKMIKKWCTDEKAHLADIKAAIGPSIGVCCYEVDDKVISAVRPHIHPFDQAEIYSEKENGRYQLNLQNLNKLLLMKSGLPEENISVSNFCTSCSPSLFFSHRKDQGKTGRMMSFIGRKGV